ncbi:MAG TPA: hypothetical protein VGC91_12965 [Pyrinomonadaceae bacterium]|jgi:hypothetical protein
MSYFKIGLRQHLFASAIVFTFLTATTAYSQAPGELPNDGILSYIFSFKAITAILITGLVAQIVWRKRRRHVNKLEVVHDNPQSQRTRKKRYDRAQMSSLLKASASGAKNPVLLMHTHDSVAVNGSNPPSARPHESEPLLAAPEQLAVEVENSAPLAEDSEVTASRSLPAQESDAETLI